MAATAVYARWHVIFIGLKQYEKYLLWLSVFVIVSFLWPCNDEMKMKPKYFFIYWGISGHGNSPTFMKAALSVWAADRLILSSWWKGGIKTNKSQIDKTFGFKK